MKEMGKIAFFNSHSKGGLLIVEVLDNNYADYIRFF